MTKLEKIKEAWIDVIGYEGFYQITIEGRVKRLQSIVKRKNHSDMNVKEKILYTSDNGDGYLVLAFSVNGIVKKKYIHRLIAQHFIENPKKLGFVNHINGIKNDNRVCNLEWCTVAENNLHAFDTGLQKKGHEHHLYNKKGSKCHNSKKVICSVSGKIYDSLTEASNELGISKSYFSAQLSGSKPNKTSMRYWKPIV